jgi:hypothetical protein
MAITPEHNSNTSYDNTDRDLIMQTQLIAGDTFIYTLDDSTYSANAFTGVLYIGSKSATGVNVSGSLKFTIAAANTQTIVPGIYQGSIRLTEIATSIVTTVKAWTVRAVNNPATTPVINIAYRMVELIDAALIGQLADGEAVESLSLSGRSVSFMSREELMNERAYWQQSINRMVNNDFGLRTIPLMTVRH